MYNSKRVGSHCSGSVIDVSGGCVLLKKNQYFIKTLNSTRFLSTIVFRVSWRNAISIQTLYIVYCPLYMFIVLYIDVIELLIPTYSKKMTGA